MGKNTLQRLKEISRTMKSISAAIIVLAGAILIAGGSHVSHSDTRLFVQIAGCVTGLTGFCYWLASIREKA